MKALLIAKDGPHFEHQREAMRALANGMMQCGIETRLKRAPTSPRPDDDFFVSWGDKIAVQPNGVPHLILECGYINGIDSTYSNNRLRFISASWNQRHGLSDWLWPSEPKGERWQALGIELRPWKVAGAYVLLLEQLPGDKAAPEVGKFRSQITDECKQRQWALRIRPHPTCYNNERSLAEDLADALFAVTWCSTAAVEAVIAGVPTYTLGPGSIAAPVTRPSLSDDPFVGDRVQWANRLAYRQWTMAELADGSAAWPHIHSGFERLAA